MSARALVGFLLAFIIVLVARRREKLSTSGALTALVIGTLAMTADVRWGLLLVAYFVIAVLLSTWRHAEKSARTSAIVAKTGPRDAVQVFANGGVYVFLALASAFLHSDVMTAAAIAAIATSMADTSATEIGSAVGGEPRSMITWARVPPGTSGAVSALGTVAMIAGSTLLGMFALVLGFDWEVVRAAIVGGVAGALADSLLGSTVQERRSCPACGTLTERRLHNCHPAGVVTDVVGGVRGFDNDWVNLTSTVIGAFAAGLSRGGV
ncbi:MAG TPA: DUF92 domain-containing protein [Gemmatimonadaceae bacterium]|nr:DUF92 domain-containing protein [Gemmatimonadaceae bacterium]